MSSRKFYLAFLIAALLLSAFPVAGALAAPDLQDGGPEMNDLEQSWADKLAQLQAAAAFFNNFQTRPGQNRNDASIGQYLDKYAATLGAAQTLLVNGSGFDINGQVVNQNQARRSVQQLNAYLSLLRGLRDKIGEGGGNNNNNFNNNNLANSGVSIPVTGGSETTTGQPANQNTNQGTSLAATWGNQWRELQAAQAWFNRFQTRPGQNRNNEQISRYLDQYAFALRQANAVILGGIGNSNNQSTGSEGATFSPGSPQQQLAMWLHMMRGLRQKIGEGGNNNNDDE